MIRDAAGHRRMLLPWAIGFTALTFLPMIASLVLSFHRVDVQHDAKYLSWIGTDHYVRALAIDGSYNGSVDDQWSLSILEGTPRDPEFHTSVFNSLFFTLFSVPLCLCTSLCVALLLCQPVAGAVLFRAAVYLPHILGGVATIVIWSWLFNPQFGWINQGIRFVYAAMDPMIRLFADRGTTDWPLPNWLYSPAGCKPAVIIMSAWTMGASMLIFLAALRRVPRMLYDAAELDGAGTWGRFRSITIPQITPAILFNLIFGILFSMQSFSEAYLLQNRQQDDGLLFSVLYIYRTAFEPPYELGYASALAWVLLLITGVLVAPFLWSARRWVHYEGAR